MSCKTCITMKKCCGEFFADGACCGQGEPITVKCPTHAIVEAVATHLTRNMRESEAA